MIPGWIMEGSFWLSGLAIWAVLSVLAAVALHLLLFSSDEKKSDPSLVTVPEEVYRIVELREFVDALWFKLYGHAIDDFRLVRIDRALGRATVGEFRIKVMRELPSRAFADRDIFLTLARAAAIDAEIAHAKLSRTGDVNPVDLIEFQKIADKEPAHRS